MREHTVRVGEHEKTSTEMIEWLSPVEGKDHTGGSCCINHGLIGLLFLCLVFFFQRIAYFICRQQQKLTPQKESPTYKLSP